uniref:Uncharacterized protein n=2 Tax=Anguilla anguilla TaxID=7936 RepID=A0A0E9PNG5_ANGAN
MLWFNLVEHFLYISEHIAYTHMLYIFIRNVYTIYQCVMYNISIYLVYFSVLSVEQQKHNIPLIV